MGDNVLNGTIARFFPAKGFGFIKVDNSRKEYFFHMDDLYEEADKSRLVEGANVTFFEKYSQKGPRAENVQLVS